MSRIATRAKLYPAAATALADVLGRVMLKNFEISLPVLAMRSSASTSP
jgi:multiple antibiotic resistance protein